jgi:putative aminopeptidase FrvX
MNLPAIDKEYLLNFLVGLLDTPSPTGLTEQAITYVEKALSKFPEVEVKHTTKGALLATLPGQRDDAPRAISAHVDTLGAMVKEIKPNGRLAITRIGGLILNTVETEGCSVYTVKGNSFRGSLLLNKASGHVYSKDVTDTKREENSMEVRLDVFTTTAEETLALGIEVGDFIAFDPRVEVSNGFVRSRFLDDKACVAAVLATVKALYDAGLKPAQKTYLYFTNHEEVGHGGATGLPEDTTELVVNDMAAIGEGQTSDEFHASICVKDGGGPYDHALSVRLRQLADQYNIPHKVDIYTYYGSDGTAYWRAGGSAAVALIGPGIDASHNYERTHQDALVANVQWNLAYLLN